MVIKALKPLKLLDFQIQMGFSLKFGHRHLHYHKFRKYSKCKKFNKFNKYLQTILNLQPKPIEDQLKKKAKKLSL